MNRLVRFRIKRCDRRDAEPYWESFEIPCGTQTTIAQALHFLRERPVNAHGKAVAPVVFDAFCRFGCDGSCGLLVNGRVAPSCATKVAGLPQPVRLEPLSKFPVRRDLSVDLSGLFDALVETRAWVEADGFTTEAVRAGFAFAGPVAALADCVHCGACLEACPQYGPSYRGALAAAQAAFYNAHPVGALDAGSRLSVLMSSRGIDACGDAQNCARVCPQNIPLVDILDEARRETSRSAWRRIFG